MSLSIRVCEILELAVGVAVDKQVLYGFMSIIQLCAEVYLYCNVLQALLLFTHNKVHHFSTKVCVGPSKPRCL